MKSLEVEWKDEWFLNIPKFPQFFWTDKANQRKFLETLFEKLNLKEPKEMASVPREYIELNDGKSLVGHYSGSMFHMLKGVFPGGKKNVHKCE